MCAQIKVNIHTMKFTLNCRDGLAMKWLQLTYGKITLEMQCLIKCLGVLKQDFIRSLLGRLCSLQAIHVRFAIAWAYGIKTSTRNYQGNLITVPFV